MTRFLTPAEAETRFGALYSTMPNGSKSWVRPGDDSGYWNPVFQSHDSLIGYEWVWF